MHAPQRPTNREEFEAELQLFQDIVEDDQKRDALVQTTGDDAQEWLDSLQLVSINCCFASFLVGYLSRYPV